MPHSNLGEREYVMLDDLEANVEEEKDDIVNDITELSKEHKKTHGPLSGNSSSSGVSGARRRLSLSGRGSSFPFLSSRQSTSSLLEHVLMKNVSRSPSFNTSSGGFFPYPQSAPSFSRLHIPWSSTGAPRDSREADLLCGLAMALCSYGAPLYRAEHRISQAAQELGLPISLFCLPSTMMVSIVNIGKLSDVDRLARRMSNLRVIKAATQSSRRVSTTSEKGRPSTSATSIQQSNRIADAADLSRASVAELPDHPDKCSDNDLDCCLTELQTITTSPGGYRRIVRIIAGAINAGVIAVLLFKGSWADGLAALLFGAFTSGIVYLSDLLGLEAAVELFAAMLVAALARFIEPFQFWGAISGTGKGLCHEIVSLAGVCQLLPGTAITLGMLELGSSNPVAGSVRMFQAFIRALKLGYGLTTGSRLGIRLLQLFDAWQDQAKDVCPQASTAIDLWRLPLWIPMNISIMIGLRAYPWQWGFMSLTSFIGFCVSLLASQWFNFDITAGMAAFSMALVANMYARRTNEIAVGGILSGITWLVPGGVGVRGAMAALSKDGNAGTAFGIDMITRAMSIAVGLYVANVVAFPIMTDQQARDAFWDKMMTV